TNGGFRAYARDNSGNFGEIYSAGGDLSFFTGLNIRAVLNASGQLGLGLNNGNPLATLDVRGTSVGGGTLPVASFSGQTSFAATVIDQSGSGDLFTASKSGATKFTILNNGNVQINNLAAGVVHSSSTGLLSSSGIVNGDLTAGSFTNIQGVGTL